MTEGSNQGLFVVVAIVIFGIFVSTAYFLFGISLKPALASIFKDGLENVNNVMGIDSSYNDWVKDLESKGYVVANDSDFIGDKDGEFRYIGKSKKVIIPKIIKGVTITKTTYMFSNTVPVEAVAMKNPNVTDMSHMFDRSQSTSLDLSNLFTENVTDMSNMFDGSHATSLDLSSFDTSKVTDMSGMFWGIEATSLDLSSFNTSNVTNMESMFSSSPATKLDLSNFDTSNVTNMKYMFRGSQATKLDLSSFDTSNVRNMHGMFAHSNAKSLNLSGLFNTSRVRTMNSMFAYSQANELDLSNFNISGVTIRLDMFKNCQATIGYARNSDDATKFNNTPNKPDTLNFVVK